MGGAEGPRPVLRPGLCSGSPGYLSPPFLRSNESRRGLVGTGSLRRSGHHAGLLSRRPGRHRPRGDAARCDLRTDQPDGVVRRTGPNFRRGGVPPPRADSSAGRSASPPTVSSVPLRPRSARAAPQRRIRAPAADRHPLAKARGLPRHMGRQLLRGRRLSAHRRPRCRRRSGPCRKRRVVRGRSSGAPGVKASRAICSPRFSPCCCSSPRSCRSCWLPPPRDRRMRSRQLSGAGL